MCLWTSRRIFCLVHCLFSPHSLNIESLYWRAVSWYWIPKYNSSKWNLRKASNIVKANDKTKHVSWQVYIAFPCADIFRRLWLLLVTRCCFTQNGATSFFTSKINSFIVCGTVWITKQELWTKFKPIKNLLCCPSQLYFTSLQLSLARSSPCAELYK